MFNIINYSPEVINILPRVNNSDINRIATVRESQGEKGLFLTGQGKSGNVMEFCKKSGKNFKKSGKFSEFLKLFMYCTHSGVPLCIIFIILVIFYILASKTSINFSHCHNFPKFSALCLALNVTMCLITYLFKQLTNS